MHALANRETKNRCQNCQTHVTPDFVRVFGQNGHAYGCFDCLTRGAVRGGEAARPPRVATDGGEQ